MAQQPSRRSTRFSMRSKQLGQLLQDNGDVGAEQIAKALKTQEREGGLIGQILRRMGACDEHAVAAALLKQVQVTDIHCEDLEVGSSVLGAVPLEQCEADKLCPFERLGNLLCVVMGNPLNRRAINTIEEKSRLKVKPFKAPWPKIKLLIDKSYTEENLSRVDESAPQLEVGDADEDVQVVDSLDGDVGIQAPMEIAPPVAAGAVDLDEEEEAPHAAEPELPPEPEIEGLDNLDESNAEVIEVDKRGLRRSNRPTFADEPINLPKGEARINVNLDELDVDEAAEVVETGEMEHEDSESLEEISASAGRPSTARGAPRAAPAKTALRKPAVEGFAPFEEVDLAYFYADGIAPPEDAEPDPGLLELVENLPVAELVAESLDEYKASLEAEAEPEPAPAAQDRKLPVEAQPAPAEPVPAVTLSDEEFKKLINGLDVDPIGEWEHTYAEQGPLEVVAYDS